MIISSGRRVLPPALAFISATGGAIVALHYHRLGLTLSHYDARGHLVVARRIFDSITPGWQQIGAVWLPLPHLLNAIPVQVDAWYQSGASAVAISIASFAVTVGAIAWMLLALTGSAVAATTGAAAFALNPNVLYLQATPMSEPLLLGLTTLAIAMLLAWAGSGASGADLQTSPDSGVGRASRATTPRPTTVGLAFALACMTRYESWPVTVLALAAAGLARWRGGEGAGVAIRRVASIAVVPVLAIAGFFVLSRIVMGEWFVTSGFFVPENSALGQPLAAAAELWWGLHTLSGYWLVALGGVGLIALVVRSVRRDGTPALVVLALAGMAVLPWMAFMQGHPYRIRYVVPLLAIEAIGAGAAAALLPRARVAGAILLAAAIAYDLHPLDSAAPMVVEAQWDRPNVPMRAQVTACLGLPGTGEKIMASMGSLGHYMQETSQAGFRLRDFLHEGNGDIWLAALENGPRAYAGWVLIEEKAEGGDMLATRAREQPRFLDGYARVCEGAGLALYKRDEGKGLRAN